MAYKKQLEKCLEVMKEYDAPKEMFNQFTDVFNWFDHQPNAEEVVQEFVASCVRFNFTRWIDGTKEWFVRDEDHFSETAKEEICYRRGFVQGMYEMARILGKKDEDVHERLKNYRIWRKSSFFQCGRFGVGDTTERETALKKIRI